MYYFQNFILEGLVPFQSVILHIVANMIYSIISHHKSRGESITHLGRQIYITAYRLK